MVAAGVGGFLVAVLAGCLVIRWKPLHARFSQDLPQAGPQKFHEGVIPRIGGVAIYAGLLAAALAVAAGAEPAGRLLGITLGCALCAFAGGLAEDLTKRISVKARLLLTFASAAIGFCALDARIVALDLPGIDWMLQASLVSFALTLFAVGGFAHAMNIVDGFNGLSGVVALIFLAGIAHVAQTVGDAEVMRASLLLAAAILGFLMCNFPRGLIFLGDGGAYLIGFLIAEFAVLLVQRNTQVSPWFALTLLLYPVFETVFSIYRKRVLRQQSPGEPDGLHLHMLIHKRLLRRFGASSDARIRANALTSPFLWVLSLFAAVPAVLFWDNSLALQASAFGFVLVYLWAYSRIVRFRTPRWLVVRRVRVRELKVEGGEGAAENIGS